MVPEIAVAPGTNTVYMPPSLAKATSVPFEPPLPTDPAASPR